MIMIKTDNRHYNTSSKRDLSIEMNLWCILSGKMIEAKGCTSDGKPVKGKIVDLKYEPGRKTNHCRVYLDNGAEYALKIKYGKIVPETKFTIL